MLAPLRAAATGVEEHRRQETPIVFINAHGDGGVRPRLPERGAAECLFKPFSDTVLLAALNAALRLSRPLSPPGA